MTDLTGQFGLTKIRGRAGWWIRLGQFLLGDDSPWTHAFIVVGDNVVEAMPGGALLTPLSVYTSGDRAADTIFSDLPLTDAQRLAVAGAALRLIGTPYSALDYLALALAQVEIRPSRLRRYIADTGRMICSQLVDEVLRRAGYHLFSDGRQPQDVTPGDLARYLTLNGARHGTDS